MQASLQQTLHWEMAQRSLSYKPSSQKFLAYLEAPFKPPVQPPVQAAFQAPTIIHGIKEGILTGIKGHAAIHGLRCHLYMQNVEPVIKSYKHTSLDRGGCS